jgi:hypothetical protein
MKLVTSVVVVVLGSVAIACSAPAPTKKSANATCAKDPTKCPSPSDSTAGDPNAAEDPPISSTPDPSSVNSADPPEDAGHADASHPDAAKPDSSAPVNECTALDACCSQLGAAGYNTTTCRSFVTAQDQTKCKTQHASYKSFGDCT